MKTILCLAVLLSISVSGIGLVRAAESDPEIVLATYHVKEGKTDELAQLLDKAWATYQRLGMVLDKPHLVMKGKEKGGAFVAEILSWKSHSRSEEHTSEL